MEVLLSERPWYLGYLHDRCNFQAKLAQVHQRIGKNSSARGKPQYEGIPFVTVVAHQSQLDTLLGLKRTSSTDAVPLNPCTRKEESTFVIPQIRTPGETRIYV